MTTENKRVTLSQARNQLVTGIASTMYYGNGGSRYKVSVNQVVNVETGSTTPIDECQGNWAEWEME